MVQSIRIVCGTRASRDEFFRATALGCSLALYGPSPLLQFQIFDRNTTGLATIYNKAIDDAGRHPAVLVFVHDDVHICDFFWKDQVFAAARRFDLVGVAGNRRRVARQPCWAFVDTDWTWDSPEFLSGAVGHGKGFPCDSIDVFGPSGVECKLLDGLMLVADSARLHNHKLRFDSRFDFHFYDMDLCRQGEIAGLHMGTWPLSVVHESGGAFGTPPWCAGYRAYLDKWGE